METGRRETRAGLVRAASAEARLADVVRRAGKLRTQSMVSWIGLATVAKQTGSDSIARAQSIPKFSSALCSRAILRLSIHQCGGTPTIGRLVEAARDGRIHAGSVA